MVYTHRPNLHLIHRVTLCLVYGCCAATRRSSERGQLSHDPWEILCHESLPDDIISTPNLRKEEKRAELTCSNYDPGHDLQPDYAPIHDKI